MTQQLLYRIFKNTVTMKQYILPVLAASLLLTACGNSKKDDNAALNDKKAKLEKLKGDKSKADEEIRKLQEELKKLDTAAANAAIVKLVSTAPVTTQNFEHFIDLQGKVDADNISYVSPRMGPAQVKAVYIRQGQYVKKGQLLLKLDDVVIQQSIVAANKNLEGIKTQLGFAKNIYQRQKNLWDQGIGTEVQLITAKTNVEGLENQLRAAEENIKVIKEQQKGAYVYSDVNGVADVVSIRVGETFSGMTQMGPQIQIVNNSSLKVTTNVPENYISRIRTGSSVVIEIPDAGQRINSSISLISQSIDPTQRGFVAEAPIPGGGSLKPNQLAVVRIKDYSAPNAVVIPVNLVQSDENTKYVYVATKSSNGKMTATKKPIQIGESYGDLIEVKMGLTAGEQIITAGYQGLYQGQVITTSQQ